MLPRERDSAQVEGACRRLFFAQDEGLHDMSVGQIEGLQRPAAVEPDQDTKFLPADFWLGFCPDEFKRPAAAK